MGESYRKQEIYPITRKWGLLAAICTSPLFIMYAFLGDRGRGRAAWVSAGIVFIVIRAFWALRKRIWFWLTVTMIALLHVPLIMFIPWGGGSVYYGGLMAVALPDFGIAYGIIRLVERAMNRGTRGLEQ